MKTRSCALASSATTLLRLWNLRGSGDGKLKPEHVSEVGGASDEEAESATNEGAELSTAHAHHPDEIIGLLWAVP